MIKRDQFADLFRKEVERLSDGEGLTPEERARIILTFQKAMEDPFMNDHQIFRLLTDEGVAAHEDSRDQA